MSWKCPSSTRSHHHLVPYQLAWAYSHLTILTMYQFMCRYFSMPCWKTVKNNVFPVFKNKSLQLLQNSPVVLVSWYGKKQCMLIASFWRLWFVISCLCVQSSFKLFILLLFGFSRFSAFFWKKKKKNTCVHEIIFMCVLGQEGSGPRPMVSAYRYGPAYRLYHGQIL